MVSRWNPSPDFSDWASWDYTNLIRNLGQVGLTEVLAALTSEAEAVMGVSKSIVPVDDGVLLASADEVGINVSQDGSRGEVAFGYGGLASEYSIVQHETPPPGGDPDPNYTTDRRYQHNAGQSWKFLERPTLEAQNGMEQRLASRIDIEGAV